MEKDLQLKNRFVSAPKKDKKDRYTTVKAIEDFRAIWFSHFAGNLSTINRENHPLSGYPVTSVVPYVFDDNYQPIVMIAGIAEHTQNAKQNQRACLFLRENDDYKDVQTQWRVCAVGDLAPIDKLEHQQISKRYFAHYPKAKDYDLTHDFAFFRLTCKKFRVIMGFGDIRWIAADAPFNQAALPVKDQQYIVDHMNNDHIDAIKHYLSNIPAFSMRHDLKNIDDKLIAMTAINPWGCTLKYADGLYFLPFPEVIKNTEEAHRMLVKLARL